MKNVLKKSMSVLLAAVMILIAVPFCASAAGSDIFVYDVWNGEVILSGCNTSVSGTITVPSTINGYPVTRIESHAFEGCSKISQINLPDSIKEIGAHAFDDTGFYHKASNWNNNVLYIGKFLVASKSFSGACDVKSGTTVIAESAFVNGKGLQSVTFPNSLLYIGAHSFAGCTGLKQIIIPDSVKSIGDNAFDRCISLTSVKLGSALTSVGEYAFCGCTALKSVNIPNSVKTIGSYAFGYYFNSEYDILKISGFKILCKQSTAAYHYATKNGFAWELPSAAKLHSVSIDNTSVNYKSTAQLNTQIDADAGIAYSVQYSSSDTDIVTVDDNGKVYGAKTGEATITCTVTDANGNFVSDTCTVKVTYAWWQVLIRILLLGFLWY